MTEQEEADRYEDDFYADGEPPCSPRGVLDNTFDSPDTYLNNTSDQAFGSASANAALKRVADQGAQGFVDALEPKTKRARTSDTLDNGSSSVSHEGEFKATYRVDDVYPNGRVKLILVKGDGPKSFACVPDNLCTISPFVDQVVLGHLVNGKPTVRGVCGAKKSAVTPAMFNKHLPENYPKVHGRWRPGFIKKRDLPPFPAYAPLARNKSYFTLLPVYGYKVVDQLPDNVLDDIVNKFTDNQQYLFLASTGLRIPAHLACAPVLLPTPANDNRAIAILEACKLYKHMMESYEHRQPLSVTGPDYAQSALVELGMVERVDKQNTFRPKAPYAIRPHIELMVAHYDVEVHHFDALCNLWPFMLSLNQKKTLFLFPSDMLLDLAKEKLYKTDFACASLIGKTADNINQAFRHFEQVVVMFGERVTDAHWRLFDTSEDETIGKKIVCVGDRHHFLTTPFGTHFFGGYSHLWNSCQNRTEHPWEQPERAELWQPGVHELLIKGDFAALFGTPFNDFQIHRGDCSWQDIKRCVKYLAKNQRDEHTPVVPSNAVVLCGPSVLKKAQTEFLTLDDSRKWDAGRKTPVFSYIDLLASKVSNVSGTKVDLKQKLPMQWDLENTHPSQFRLLNLTTIYQCFATPKDHVVFVIDLLTTRRDLAVALKFAEVGKGKVDVFWAPEIPASQRQFSKLN